MSVYCHLLVEFEAQVDDPQMGVAASININPVVVLVIVKATYTSDLLVKMPSCKASIAVHLNGTRL